MFQLHPNLEKDTIFIKSLKISDLVLMNNKNFPWFILVPRIENASEIFDLNDAEQSRVWEEISNISQFVKNHFQADKMNIAALGNVVPQLHIHIIARFKTDPVWPNPVWGMSESTPYTHQETLKIKELFLTKPLT
jgi:diadenosine tetraphosphate (Ap4A) HIT family hydrolase